MKKSKILCALLYAVSVLTFASCGGSPAASTEPATETKADTEAGSETSSEASAAKGQTVSLMAWWDGGEQEAGNAKVAACEKELGVKIDANYVTYDDYLSKLNTLAAAGSMPDVFALYESLVYDWGEQGMLMNLKDAYESQNIDLDSTYIPTCMFATDNEVWAIGYDITTMFLYYNKAMFDAAGVEYPSSDASNPWTWDQFVDAAKKMTTDSAGKTPNDSGFNYDSVTAYGTLMPTSWTGFLPLLHTNGTGILNDDGTALGITSDAGIKVIQSVADLSLVEKCAPTVSIAKSSFSDASTMVMNNQLGMLIDGGWAFSNYANEKFDIGVAPVPVFDHAADISWTCGFCVSADTKVPDAALAVHRWFTDFTNYIDACETAGTGLGGLPQSKSVYDSDEYVGKWAKMMSQQMVDTTTNIINADTTILGDNVTVKNFSPIVDDVLIPQLDKVWLGEMTAKEALSTMDAAVADQIKGYWN